MRKRIFLRVLVTAAAIIVVAIAAVALDFAFRPRTPGIDGPTSVARLEQVTLNGTKEWVLIRGTDTHNTILLFLHGGPGMPMMYLGHAFQRDLEKHFVVVHWDRRGAGKSYDAGIGWKPSVRSNLDDLHALAGWLHHEFPGRKLILAGHSWGTYLGLLAVRERPDLYDAYVGTGQMSGDHKRDNAARVPFFRHEAEKRGDTKMLARLAKGNEPNGDDLFAYDAEIVGTHGFMRLLCIGLAAPEYTFHDIMNVPKGSSQLEHRMRYDVVQGPLDEEVLSVKVPVYFLLGRHDWNTPSTLAAQYLSRLDAPQKGLYWFERSAHFAFLEEPERFTTVMQTIDGTIPDKTAR